MHLNSYWIKIGLSGLGAVAAIAAAAQLVKPPPLTPVAVLAKPVAALQPVTASEITWIPMEHPPTGTVTAWAGDPLAASALAAGTVLTQADFSSAAQAVALKAGEVRYVVTVTPASAVVAVGQRVDLWSVGSPAGASNGTAPQELARGVRVIGLFTSNGTPIGTASAASGGLLSGSSSTATVPALAALAVPQSAMPALMAADPSQTMLLVQDPAQTSFALVTGASTATTPSSGSPGTAQTPPTSSVVSPPHASGSRTTRHATKKPLKS